jgi:hypothetical protein
MISPNPVIQRKRSSRRSCGVEPHHNRVLAARPQVMCVQSVSRHLVFCRTLLDRGGLVRRLRYPCFQLFDLNPATMTFAGKSLFKLVVILPRCPLVLGSCSSES